MRKLESPGSCGGSRPWKGWTHGTGQTPFQPAVPPEVRDQAVRLVFDAIRATGERHGHVSRIARQLDIGPETLRNWVRQAEVDRMERAGLTTEERARMAEPERENLPVQPGPRSPRHPPRVGARTGPPEVCQQHLAFAMADLRLPEMDPGGSRAWPPEAMSPDA
jgi:transposase-like protein